jgi:hypothetical protein
VEWSVSDLSPVLGVIGKLDCVVIGGQAVNIWCEYYARGDYVPAAQWDELKPFTSLDLDVLGSSVEAEEAGAELHASRVEIADPFAKSDSPICGFVEAAVGGRELGIHFLHRIAGVGRDEVERTAVSIEAGGSNVRVMHPLLCLEGRVEMLLRRIGEAGHQDQLHLRRGILVVRALLAEQLAREGAKRFLSGVERVFRLARSYDGLLLAQKCGVKLEEAIPIEVARAHSDEGLARFCDKRWPQMLDILESKRARLAAVVERTIDRAGRIPPPGRARKSGSRERPGPGR